MIEITAESVVEGLDALVAQEGENFIYKKNAGACTYTKHGKADCIVGRFLVAQGVPIERLAEADKHPFGIRAPGLINQLREEGVVTCTDGALDILDVAQDYQDSGETWGVAVNHAKKPF